jgi:hypothetical protein
MIPAYRGEFGLKILHHVPRVHAACLAAPCVVEIEAGEEALYPRAAEWRVVPRVPETWDAFRYQRPNLRGLPTHGVRFQPVPHVPQAVAPVDVVIAPRRRGYVPAKNWPHWRYLVDELRDAGLRVFAGGVADASDTDLDVPAAWDYARPLDATLAAILSARLVFAPCSGLAHLSVLCGTNLLLLTHGDRVSPGPVHSSSGRLVSTLGNPLKWRDYYTSANHLGATLERVDAWNRPAAVPSAILRALNPPARP